LWTHLALLARLLRDVPAHTRAAAVLAEKTRLLARDAVLWHGTVATIAERRFQGYDPLLSRPRQGLDDLKRHAADLLARYNDRLETSPGSGRRRAHVGRSCRRPSRGTHLPSNCRSKSMRGSAAR
jgi:hypothetical protein